MTDDPKVPQDATPVDPDHDDGTIYEDPEAKTDVPGQNEPEEDQP